MRKIITNQKLIRTIKLAIKDREKQDAVPAQTITLTSIVSVPHECELILGAHCSSIDDVMNLCEADEKWKDAALFRITTAFVNSQIVNIIVKDGADYIYAGFVRVLSDWATIALIQDCLLIPYFDSEINRGLIFNELHSMMRLQDIKYLNIDKSCKFPQSNIFNSKISTLFGYVQPNCFKDDKMLQAQADKVAKETM